VVLFDHQNRRQRTLGRAFGVDRRIRGLNIAIGETPQAFTFDFFDQNRLLVVIADLE
jgi:hypothetical protein